MLFKKVAESVYLLPAEGTSSNVYLIKSGKNALVDAGQQANGPRLEQALSELSLKPNDIAMVLHTHGHADHFSGAYLFTKAEKIMSMHDASFVNEKHEHFTAACVLGSDFYPEITSFYSKGQVIQVGGFKFEVVETPGHTNGSVSLYNRARKILFSGDTLFKGAVGRYDLISASKTDLRKSIKKLSKLDFYLLLPGHGRILEGSQRENIELGLKILE